MGHSCKAAKRLSRSLWGLIFGFAEDVTVWTKLLQMAVQNFSGGGPEMQLEWALAGVAHCAETLRVRKSPWDSLALSELPLLKASHNEPVYAITPEGVVAIPK